jgi:nucleotide-binding universal stress UspA family protein
MKILVGIDGTEKSLDALRFITRLISPGRDEVTLFFAPPQRHWSSYLSLTRESQEATIAAFTPCVFQQAADLLPADLTCRRVVPEHEHHVGRALLHAAREDGSRLIVVAAGRSSNRLRFFVGGVARSVIHQAKTPVLAHRHRQGKETSCDAPLRVLLAVDPADSMDTMATLMEEFSWPTGSRGQLIHVMDYVADERLRHWINESNASNSSAWNDALDREVGDQRLRVREHLQSLSERLPAMFRGNEPILKVGHVVEQIVQVVDSEEIDVVVVGGHHRGPVSRWLGSTTEGLLLQANASILVVHEAADA